MGTCCAAANGAKLDTMELVVSPTTAVTPRAPRRHGGDASAVAARDVVRELSHVFSSPGIFMTFSLIIRSATCAAELLKDVPVCRSGCAAHAQRQQHQRRRRNSSPRRCRALRQHTRDSGRSNHIPKRITRTQHQHNSKNKETAVNKPLRGHSAARRVLAFYRQKRSGSSGSEALCRRAITATKHQSERHSTFHDAVVA